MPNHAYIRGRKLEWDMAKLFRAHSLDTIRASGSHGVADLVVFRKGDALDMTQPIHIQELEQILDGWIEESDPRKILDPFLYGKKKYLPRGGEQRMYLTPASVWLCQLKSSKGK